MTSSFEEFQKKNKEDKLDSKDLNLDEMIAEISTFNVDLDEEEPEYEEKGERGAKNSPLSSSEEKRNIVETPPDPDEFNLAFDRELDDSFVISREVDMVPKPNINDPPELPELPRFPTMADIENLLDGKVPKVPDHFTIEVPPEFEEIVPPEPLGAPPPPPVSPGEN